MTDIRHVLLMFQTSLLKHFGPNVGFCRDRPVEKQDLDKPMVSQIGVILSKDKAENEPTS